MEYLLQTEACLISRYVSSLQYRDSLIQLPEHYNHKGTKIDGVEPKHRGIPAANRGLSNQQICIITAIQRFTHTIARTLNYGKPSSLDLLRFGECLIPAANRGLSNQQICIITAIQRFTHTIARTLNYGKPSSLDLLRFGECLTSKSFVMLDGSNSYNELLESVNQS